MAGICHKSIVFVLRQSFVTIVMKNVKTCEPNERLKKGIP